MSATAGRRLVFPNEAKAAVEDPIIAQLIAVYKPLKRSLRAAVCLDSKFLGYSANAPYSDHAFWFDQFQSADIGLELHNMIEIELLLLTHYFVKVLRKWKGAAASSKNVSLDKLFDAKFHSDSNSIRSQLTKLLPDGNKLIFGILIDCIRNIVSEFVIDLARKEKPPAPVIAFVATDEGRLEEFSRLVGWAIFSLRNVCRRAPPHHKKHRLLGPIAHFAFYQHNLPTNSAAQGIKQCEYGDNYEALNRGGFILPPMSLKAWGFHLGDLLRKTINFAGEGNKQTILTTWKTVFLDADLKHFFKQAWDGLILNDPDMKADEELMGKLHNSLLSKVVNAR
jgi:hypothetical protein